MDDFPRADLPYTAEKLKRRGILARLFFGAGLRKLENDYLNPRHGDVLASQRRYRRYLAGDRRVVVQASWSVWLPVISIFLGPGLMGIAASVYGLKKEIDHYGLGMAAISQWIWPHRTQTTVPAVLTAANSDIPVGSAAQSGSKASHMNTPASDAIAAVQQPNTPGQSATSTVDTNAQANGAAQESDMGQELSMKVQALVTQSEQQYDAGQYQSAVATAEAVLAIDPVNIIAQRLRDASRREIAADQALDAAQAQTTVPVPAPTAQATQASPFAAHAPSPPAGTCVYGCNRHSSHGLHVSVR
ncbi:hypothetical protein [Paraburkholderia adhaesiva]|uniref:hypothetical protein n=1 Tax=Paraburkholderia adhaesiva TaxID=2883244 RepID=UPI001F269F92|nr:hypothetical protein [Paraburkholderia adhaesiva]